MTRVPAWLFSFNLHEARLRKLPVEECLEGLDLTLEQLADPRSLIEWDDVIELCRRFADRGIGPDTVRDAWINVWQHPQLAQLARRLQRMPDPSVAYGPLMRANTGGYFRVFRIEQRPLPDGRVQIDFDLNDGFDSHLHIWKAIEGLLIGVPYMVGLPHAEVTSTIRERGARYVIRMPMQRSGFQRWSRSVLGFFRSNRMVDQMIDLQEQLGETFERVRLVHQQLRQQADDLRESEAQYRNIIENTADLILLLDRHARILMASPSTRRLFETDAGGVRPVRALDVVYPRDVESLQVALKTLLEEGHHPPIEFRAHGPRGRILWIEASGRRIRGADGQDQLVIVGRDITARREAEAEMQLDAERLAIEVRRRTHELQRANQELRDLTSRLIDAERIGATQELAGSVAHAINNPLAALTGNAELLREQRGSDPGVDRVLHLAARIRSVVDRTLQLSREGTLDLSLESPAALLREVRDEIEPLCKARGVRLAMRSEPKLPTIYADRTLLRAALVAVAENGVDASSPGDTLRMQARAIQGMRVVEFRFSDSGSGIAENAAERIFEPFFTTKPGGTGLGLAIARGVVLGHEGRIHFAPRKGGGTVATVEVPFYMANRALPQRSRPAVAAERPD